MIASLTLMSTVISRLPLDTIKYNHYLQICKRIEMASRIRSLNFLYTLDSDVKIIKLWQSLPPCRRRAHDLTLVIRWFRVHTENYGNCLLELTNPSLNWIITKYTLRSLLIHIRVHNQTVWVLNPTTVTQSTVYDVMFNLTNNNSHQSTFYLNSL